MASRGTVKLLYRGMARSPGKLLPEAKDRMQQFRRAFSIPSDNCWLFPKKTRIDLSEWKLYSISGQDQFWCLPNPFLICTGRGQSTFFNLCPIPIAFCCNKNMFKTIQISWTTHQCLNGPWMLVGNSPNIDPATLDVAQYMYNQQ